MQGLERGGVTIEKHISTCLKIFSRRSSCAFPYDVSFLIETVVNHLYRLSVGCILFKTKNYL